MSIKSEILLNSGIKSKVDYIKENSEIKMENLIMNTVINNYLNDYEELGEATNSIYNLIFGKEFQPLFEAFEENLDYLTEAFLGADDLLLEAPKIHRNQTGLFKNASDLVAVGGGVGSGAIMGAGEKANRARSKAQELLMGKTVNLPTNNKAAQELLHAGAEGGSKMGLINVIKNFATKLKDRFADILSIGASWAKNVADKGIAWLGSASISEIAIPAAVLAGSVAGGVALVKKLRKAKGKRLKKEEEEKLREKMEDEEDEIKKYKEKMEKASEENTKKAS